MSARSHNVLLCFEAVGHCVPCSGNSASPTKDIDLDFTTSKRGADSLHHSIRRAIDTAARGLPIQHLQVSELGKSEVSPRWKVNFEAADGRRQHIEIEVSRDPARAGHGHALAPSSLTYWLKSPKVRGKLDPILRIPLKVVQHSTRRWVTPEKAVLDWLYLAASPRSHRTGPPRADIDITVLNSRQLARLAKKAGIDRVLSDWLRGSLT